MQGQGTTQELVNFREQTGEEGLWTNSMFSGMPGYLVDVRYSGDWVNVPMRVLSLGLPNPANLLFIGMVCYYIMLLVFGVRPGLAIAGAIAFGITTFNIISVEAGHNSKVRAIAYMPLVLAGIQLALKKQKKLAGFALTALALAIIIRVNHLQITYYLLLMVVIFGIVMLVFAIKEKRSTEYIKTIGILVLAALLAVGTNFGRLWSLYEYGKFSIRGKSELSTEDGTPTTNSGLDRDYAFAWSNGIWEGMTLLIPNFYGGASNQALGNDSEVEKALRQQGIRGAQLKQYVNSAPTYWGDQPFTSGPIYAGAIICFLFVLGIFFAEKKYVWWLVLATILALMFSWGDNFKAFNYFMFDHLPGYNKFRSVTMALIIALTAMPLLGFLGLEKLLKEGLNGKNQKILLYTSGGMAGLCILLIFFTGIFSFQGIADSRLPEWFGDALIADRKSMWKMDTVRSAFFILAFSGILFAWLKKKLSALSALPTMILLVLLDIGLVDGRYLKEDNFKRNPARQFFTMNEADQFILQDKDPDFRVYNLQNPFNDGRTSYYHKSIGGYHGAKLRRYQDLIEKAISPETNKMINNLRAGNTNMSYYPILNMLNARYILAGNTKESVIRNSFALGNLWFISNIEEVNNPDEEIAAVSKINTGTSAVVDISKFNPSQTQFSASGSAKLTSYAPNTLNYEVDAKGKSFVVFSEIYYPNGWKATIDGKEAPILRANYVLRALEVPEGKHEINFSFKPDSYVIGNKIMMGSSLLLTIICLTAIG
ncbi:YfhO family protein, partial [Xanthovirga aplysinae]|uniref:YfhO family protein n=1 Tax=Xanthovirga aplysinae TaxID=2529853 RepID=UPI0031B5C13B